MASSLSFVSCHNSSSGFGRKPKLTPHQKREAINRRDKDGETLRSIGRSYNVSAATISRLTNGGS
jgi:hypothetical protein